MASGSSVRSIRVLATRLVTSMKARRLTLREVCSRRLVSCVPIANSTLAHSADEFAGIDVGQDQFAAFFVLGEHADRAVDDEIQDIGRIAGADDRRLARIAASMAITKETVQRWLVKHKRTGRLHAIDGALQRVAKLHTRLPGAKRGDAAPM